MASDVTYSTNPADWTQLEGVYISEEPVASQVQGSDLNVTGWAGRCVKGPSSPTYVNSSERFQSVYGGMRATQSGAIIGEVAKGLVGKQFAPLWVRRVTASGAAAATLSLTQVRVSASSPGLWGNNLSAGVEGTDASLFDLRLIDNDSGKQWLYQGFNVTGTNDNCLAIVGDDDAVPVKVTKLAAGRPANASPAPLTGGTEGTLADSDYIAGITDIAYTDGVAICLVPEASPTQSALNAAILQLVADANDRVYLTWSGSPGNTVQQEVTAKGTQITTPHPRIYWFFNTAFVLDPLTGTKIEVAPHTWAASILSRNAVDVHIGALQTLAQTMGVTGLHNEALRRADLIQLRKAGICSFEHQKRGFRFRSGIATDSTTRLVDRRQRDFLQISSGDYLAPFVDEPNVPIRRAMMAGGLSSFCDRLKSAQRIVDDYSVKIVGTDEERANNMESIQMNVRLIGHTEEIILKTNVATGVTIDAGAVATPVAVRSNRISGRGLEGGGAL